jgi:predicted patatin/cPLA2 family phospholipase
MTRKTCIIAEGGGLRGSYVVGAVKALVEEFQITAVDLAIGTSSGAATLAYYVTGQFDSITNIWTKLLTTWKFASFRNLFFGNPVLDIDYLVDDIFKQQDRLNIEVLKSGPTEFLVPATNYHTGRARYFSNRDGIDFFEVLRATMAIQIFYGRTVEIGGNHYVDGALAAPIGFSTALDAGATDIIVISTRPIGFRRTLSVSERLMTQLFTRSWPEPLKQQLEDYPSTYNSGMEMVRQELQKSDRNIILIQPASNVIAGKLDNSRKNLLGSIEQGYTDTCRHSELISFLSPTKSKAS